MFYIKNALKKDTYNVFSIINGIFATVLTLFAIFLVDGLTYLKLSNSKVTHQRLTPRLTITFGKIFICRKDKNTSFDMQSYL